MVDSSTGTAWLEKWNARMFSVAAIMSFSYALLKGLKAYADIGVITAIDVMWGGLVLLTPVIALFGFYPRLREEAPRVSHAIGAITGLAGLTIVAIQLQLLITTLTMPGYPAIPGEVPAWSVVATLLVFVLLALGYLVSGIATWRTDVAPQPVAGLLVIPALGWVGLVVGPTVLPAGDYLGLVVYLPISVALGAIGYRLGVEDHSTGHTTSAPDSLVR